MAKGDVIPDADHISRNSGGDTFVDGRISGVAFRLRQDEEYLSVNWLEFLQQPNRDAEMSAVRAAFIAKGRNLTSKGKFSVLNVGKMRNHVELNTDDGRVLRVLHEHEDLDPSHSGIYNMEPDPDMIGDLMADVIEEIHPAREPGL